MEIRRGIIAVTILLGLLAVSCGEEKTTDVRADAEQPATSSSPEETDDADEEPEFSCKTTTRAKADFTLAAINRQGGYEWDWKPARLEFPAGQKVTLKIVNPSNAVHDFSAGSCISENFAAKKSTTISFTTPARPITFYCSLHPTGMVGKIVPG